MKMSEGVEWASHACLLLAALPPDAALRASDIAAFHELPSAYMAKHLQALARAGVVKSVRGAAGGYRLARPPTAISLWDIRQAICGPGPDFVCREIRGRGPCAAKKPASAACFVAHAFWEAERLQMEALQQTTLASLMITLAASYDADGLTRFRTWLAERVDLEAPSSPVDPAAPPG